MSQNPLEHYTAADPAELVVTKRDLYVAGWTCSLGSALEYYDFALYSLASALIFGQLFFPKQDPAAALIASFGTYFIGFAVRPLGGVLFGSLGDRLGRKFVLLATVALMGGASTLIGALPTYGDVGYWAPVMLIALRILQGLGAGAEQAGASVLMTEYAPVDRRGFFASLPFSGIQLGTVLAALVYFLLLYAGKQELISSGLWRVPFLASILILGVAVYIRISLKESPTFHKLKAHGDTIAHPLRDALKTSRRTLLLGIGLRLGENGGSSIIGALAMSYIVGTVGLTGSIGALSLVCAASLGAIVVPVSGMLSDRFGRRIVYRSFAIFQVLTVFPMWYVLSLGDITSTLIVVAIGLAVGVWGMFGTQGAYMPELFGARHRYVGVSLAREVSAVIAGGIAPLIGSMIIALVISQHPGEANPGLSAWFPLGCYQALLAIGTVITTFFAPETRGRDLTDPRDAVDAADVGPSLAAAPAVGPIS
jgi:MHS family metabolite:H+ symporter-like MFS transporter